MANFSEASTQARRRNTQKEWEWAWPTQWPPRLWEGTALSAAAKTRNKGFSQNNQTASLHSHASTEVSLWVFLSLGKKKHSPRLPTHGEFLKSRAFPHLISRQSVPFLFSLIFSNLSRNRSIFPYTCFHFPNFSRPGPCSLGQSSRESPTGTSSEFCPEQM